MYPQWNANKMRCTSDSNKNGPHFYRQERNRQIKRVTSNTPKSCRKTNSRFWCAQGEDRPARCMKEKNEWQLNSTCSICMRMAPLMFMWKKKLPVETWWVSAINLRPPSSTRLMNLGHSHRQERSRQIKWIIQVAKPIYRSYPVSNLHFTFSHSSPSTRESHFMILIQK